MVADCGDHGTEVVRGAKRALFNLVEDLVEVGIDCVGAVSMSMAEVLDVLGEVTKEEDVAFTDFTRNLNVGAVAGANDEAAVEDKLHVASSRGLCSSGRNMFANVRSRANHFRLAHVIILQENNLEQVTNILVLIHHRADRVDQVDNLLGHPISRRSFTAKDTHARQLLLTLVGRHGLEAQILMNNAKDVQLLTLILVDTLDLHVKQGGRVDNNASSVLDVLRQTHLVGVLDLCPLLAKLLVVNVLLQLVEKRKVLEEVIAAAFGGNQFGQAGVGLVQPTAWCNAVCNIGELVRAVNFDKVLENGGLDEVRVEFRHAIDLVGADDGKERHAYHLGLGFLNDGYPAEHVPVVREGLFYALQKEQVDVVDDLQVPREQVLDETNGPFLEGFWEDRMVGVSKSARDNFPRGIPLQALNIDQNPLQLHNRQRRMCVIQLDRHLIRELVP
uniref:Uncharacterized protein n=1 Tax=Photinus pyralis TaxID=7054 RepID=A0A1Y1L8Q7_PHOPY